MDFLTKPLKQPCPLQRSCGYFESFPQLSVCLYAQITLLLGSQLKQSICSLQREPWAAFKAAWPLGTLSPTPRDEMGPHSPSLS